MVLFSHRLPQKTGFDFEGDIGGGGREGSWVVGPYLLGSFGFSYFFLKLTPDLEITSLHHGPPTPSQGSA